MFTLTSTALLIWGIVQIFSQATPETLEQIKLVREHGLITEKNLGVPFDRIGSLEIRTSNISLSKEILHKFTNLENLTISFCHINNLDEDIFTNCCPKLKYVDINYWKGFSEVDLKGLGTLPLERLEIINSNITQLTSRTFLGTKLKSLSLIQNNLKEIELDAFEGLDELEYLRLSHTKLSEIPRQSLAPLKNLETLELVSNGFEKFSTDNLPALPSLTDIVFIKENLREVNFDGVHKVAPNLTDVYLIANHFHTTKVIGPVKIHKW